MLLPGTFTYLKVRLILGSISFADLGISCSQNVLVLPDIKSNVPWCRGISTCPIFFYSLRNLKGLVCPKVTEAILGLLPIRCSLSECQETLSLPLRYRFESTALNPNPVCCSNFGAKPKVPASSAVHSCPLLPARLTRQSSLGL